MPGLLRGVARTAAVAGTATAVSNRVSRRQAKRWSQQESSLTREPEPTYARPARPRGAGGRPDPAAQGARGAQGRRASSRKRSSPRRRRRSSAAEPERRRRPEIDASTSGDATAGSVAARHGPSHLLYRCLLATVAAMLPAAGDPFDALGDPHRRAIVELLRGGERSVREIADELPISRPAVSRHLRLLKEAGPRDRRAARHAHGSTGCTTRGRRPCARTWSRSGATRPPASAWPPRTRSDRAAPRSFRVACSPEHAFDVWAARTSLWWPADHTVTGEAGLEIVLEPRVGGRIFERTASGREESVGRGHVWEPPRRLGYLWHLRADRPTRPTSRSSSRRWRRRDPGPDRAPRLGAPRRRGDAWRERNRRGWDTLLPWYVEIGGGTMADGTTEEPVEAEDAERAVGVPGLPRRVARPARARRPGRQDGAPLPPRALDDLHAMLKAHGDWMPLGTPTSRSRPRRGRSRRGRARRTTRSAAGTG